MKVKACVPIRRAQRLERRQRGQTFVLLAFVILFLLSLLGLVIDTVRLYILSTQALRAAEAGALAGVLYMPDYYSTISTDGQDAMTRVCAAVKQNGITSCLVPLGQVGATPSTVTGNPYQLQVTVTLKAEVFFLALVSPSLSTATISRSARAEYLPDTQLGSRVSYFGDTSAQQFSAHINGSWQPKENGDAYTPIFEDGWTDPINHPDGGSTSIPRFLPNVIATNMSEYATAIANPDQHPAGFTGAGGRLGYNYQIIVPSGVGPVNVQLLTPAFRPEAEANNSDNITDACKDPHVTPAPCTQDQDSNFMHLTYSLYSAPLRFERSQDTLLAMFSPHSYDLSTCSSGQGFDTTTQQCMTLPSYVNGSYTLYTIAQAGTYRLVVEAGAGGYGQHNYGIRLTDVSGAVFSSASGVRVAAWNDMTVSFNWSGAGTSTFDLAEIPAAYAGRTLTFSLFDPGDGTGNSTNVKMRILDPSGNAVTLPSWVRTVVDSNGPHILASNNGDHIYNGQWLHIPVQIPSTYSPTSGNDWWQVEYDTSQKGGDAITINITLNGTPVHLVA